MINVIGIGNDRNTLRIADLLKLSLDLEKVNIASFKDHVTSRTPTGLPETITPNMLIILQVYFVMCF